MDNDNNVKSRWEFFDSANYSRLLLYGEVFRSSLSSNALVFNENGQPFNNTIVNTRQFSITNVNNNIFYIDINGSSGELNWVIRGLPSSATQIGTVYRDSNGFLKVK